MKNLLHYLERLQLELFLQRSAYHPYVYRKEHNHKYHVNPQQTFLLSYTYFVPAGWLLSWVELVEPPFSTALNNCNSSQVVCMLSRPQPSGLQICKLIADSNRLNCKLSRPQPNGFASLAEWVTRFYKFSCLLRRSCFKALPPPADL